MGLTLLSKLEGSTVKNPICPSCGNGDLEKLGLNPHDNTVVCLNCGNKYPA